MTPHKLRIEVLHGSQRLETTGTTEVTHPRASVLPGDYLTPVRSKEMFRVTGRAWSTDPEDQDCCVLRVQVVPATIREVAPDEDSQLACPTEPGWYWSKDGEHSPWKPRLVRRDDSQDEFYLVCGSPMYLISAWGPRLVEPGEGVRRG
jgi:hypothetical protein